MGTGRRLLTAVGRSVLLAAVMGGVILAAPGGAPPPTPEAAQASTLVPGFEETEVIGGLTNPTVVRFASDGRVFVAEKSGLIKVYSDLADPTPTVFADLRTNVHNFWDRGLLGMALAPNFPSDPYVYVAYTFNHVLGSPSPPPRWPDSCPTPPGATTDGCVVSGRLSRLEAAGDVMTGSEQVLIEDWCQQYPSHSVGALNFGADGALYLSSGDGASFTFSDYGQEGIPPNPCGDPPGGVGTPLELPTAEGGALRSQDLRTSSDPATLDGTVIRVDPATGAALPSNPFFGSSDANVRRVIGYGLRQAFRFTIRPGTNELWVGEVGWGEYEEINWMPDPTDGVVENFGWPCYEGTPRGIFDDADFTICEDLYDDTGAHTAPYYEYLHTDQVVDGESCPVGTSSISGLAFNSGFTSSFPSAYEGALFFADYSRDCIWAMRTGGGELPSPGQLETFVADAANPVNLEFGPDGALYYVDFDNGTIQRVQWVSVGAPTVTGTTPENGATGVVRGSSPTATFSEPMDPSTLNTSTFTLVEQGTGTPLAATVSYDVPSRTATLNPDALLDFNATYVATVHGGLSGARDLDGVALPGDFSWSFSTNDSPTPVIDLPESSLTWDVGGHVDFEGHATDTEQGTLPASALSWTLLIQHCPSTCHTHTVESWPGVANGSFNAPDHEYPSQLELRLTATDERGATGTTSVVLEPETVELTFESVPSGLQLSVGAAASVTPFTRTVIVGSMNSITAVTPQVLNGTTYEFFSWSDGGAQSHLIVAPSSPATFTANYVGAGPPVSISAPRIRSTLSYPPVLTVGNGAWSGSTPMSLSYQWLRCATLDIASCSPIAGATTRSYVPGPADSGFRLRGRVTATNSFGSGVATSAASELF